MTQRGIPENTYGSKRLPSPQCQAFPECENTPEPSGYCEVHPRERKQVRMTPARIHQWLREECSSADLKRILADLGVSSIDELACVRLSVSSGGTVIRREKLIDENNTFDEIFRGRDEY